MPGVTWEVILERLSSHGYAANLTGETLVLSNEMPNILLVMCAFSQESVTALLAVEPSAQKFHQSQQIFAEKIDSVGYRVGKLAFSYTCTVRAPLGVSMALDRACKVKRKFTQCVEV